jgi:uncharacterized membrane protein YeaQ/YmgE (transglycosylase-associated protein family)
MNWSQYSGALDRIVLIGLTWAASKGWILPSDVAGIATMIVGIAGAVYAFWVNRSSNLTIKAATANPSQIIVASPELAKSTPNQPNIVSNEDVKVVTTK